VSRRSRYAEASSGGLRNVLERRSRLGLSSHGVSSYGLAVLDGFGSSVHGRAWCGAAVLGSRARLVEAGSGVAVMVRRGGARSGMSC